MGFVAGSFALYMEIAGRGCGLFDALGVDKEGVYQEDKRNGGRSPPYKIPGAAQRRHDMAETFLGTSDKR